MTTHVAGNRRRSLSRTSLLAFDPALGESIDSGRRELARRSLSVTVIDFAEGRCEPPSLDPRGSLGFLIGTGLLAREFRLMGSRSLELLGPGDLLRPWQEDAVSFVDAEITALTASSVAVLDRAFARRAAHFPGVVSGLLERAIQRSRYMAVYAAIDGLVGVHRRLHALLWTLAERWGTFHDGEVFLPVELHHSALADLVAARRPSVSSALARLQREGGIERVKGGWILRGEPPVTRA